MTAPGQFLLALDRDELPTLTALVNAFRPRALRVMVPVESGKIACSPEAYGYVQDALKGTWGRLPAGLLRHGSGLQAGERRVHAKAYRFWAGGADRVEYVFAGSPNLTSAAHSGNKNWEAAILLQTPKPGALTWWLDRIDGAPLEFAGPLDELEEIKEGTADLPLIVAFDWKDKTAEAYWNSPKPRTVTLRAAGVELARLPALPVRKWVPLDDAFTARIGQRLRTSCTATVHASESEWAPILIQEVHHDLKPDLFLDLGLTPAEIMQFWSQLSVEERLERIGEVSAPMEADEEDLEPPEPGYIRPESMFDRFAGIFHGFGALRRHLFELLEAGDELHAGRRLFGNTFDSPVRLLELVRSQHDDVQCYVTFQCAAQLLAEVDRTHPDFAADFPIQRAALEQALTFRSELRDRLREEADGDMSDFLDWFDEWFLRRVDVSEAPSVR